LRLRRKPHSADRGQASLAEIAAGSRKKNFLKKMHKTLIEKLQQTQISRNMRISRAASRYAKAILSQQ
jgi:hypothetical protein